MPTLALLDETLRLAPATNATVYDEVFDRRGEARPPWRAFLDATRLVTRDELARRTEQAEQQLRENGVNFNVFHDGEQLQRPWRLDLLPVIFAADEWRELERGLAQRARLLRAIVRDCHGPRELVASGRLPPEVLFANPAFVRQFHRLDPGDGAFLTSYAAELARRPDGSWCVMADRAESPAGAAFALENRVVVSRTIPAALHKQHVQRLAPFFVQWQETLRTLGRRHSENPRIVILSPGAKHPYYFEDVYLARYLGYSLVEGGDLAVRDDRVFLKTLAGLIPIDVIVSRGTERGIDPLELGGSAPHGVPGLLHAVRKGHVTVANTPGSGLVESPIFMAFLPRLCRELLGEELLAPSIPTWWCGDPQQRTQVFARFTELVVKPSFQASGSEELVVGRLDLAAQRHLREKIERRPELYVAQELVERSAVPVFQEGQVQTGHAALRTFLVASGEDYSLMPGGLVRYALSTEPMELSIAAGAGSKDVWVLAEGPVKPVTLLQHEDRPVRLRRTSAIFPSRVADDLFWLGQSLERADFLSRLLRAVVERLTAESAADTPELPALLRVLADQGQIEPGFAIQDLASSLPAIGEHLPRSVADDRDSHGLAAVVGEIERLASLERLWMSPDTWRKIHETSSAFRAAVGAKGIGLVDVLNAANTVIVDIAAVSGLIHDGMVRSPAWRVLDLGRRVERARDVASLLHCVLTNPAAASPPGTERRTPLDRPLLKAILEVIDCRMAYRARYLDNLQPNGVLDFCLTDETCPRSVASQLAMIAEHVEMLPHDGQDPLRTEEKRVVMSAVHAVRMLSTEDLESPRMEPIVVATKQVERQLTLLSDLLTRKYLLHSGTPRQITGELELPQ